MIISNDDVLSYLGANIIRNFILEAELKIVTRDAYNNEDIIFHYDKINLFNQHLSYNIDVVQHV
jgi:hypothetical protein